MPLGDDERCKISVTWTCQRSAASNSPMKICSATTGAQAMPWLGWSRKRPADDVVHGDLRFAVES